MDSCFVADALVGIMTYTPAEQLNATRFLRMMTATQNGYAGREAVKDAPPWRPTCNRALGIEFPLPTRDISLRLYAEKPNAEASGFTGRDYGNYGVA